MDSEENKQSTFDRERETTAISLGREDETDLSVHRILARLSIIDKYLPIWIFLAMALGVILGYFVPTAQSALSSAQFDSISAPIAVGLLWMMFPILCRVQFEYMPRILRSKQIWQQLAFSIFVNWIMNPLIMTMLAWATLPDLPGYRDGVVLVGMARCIAMVLLWNKLAGGNEDYCALLVAINSVLQIALYSPIAYFYLREVPGWFGATQQSNINISIWDVARSVLFFLGIPLVAAIITRFSLLRIKGFKWYTEQFLPFFAPTALVGLLFTIVAMFAMQGRNVVENIIAVLRVSVPLLLYFTISFFAAWWLCRAIGFQTDLAITQSFTAASNNFELAIAVAVGAFGASSQQALATTVGPLIEVPVLLGLVYVTLWVVKRQERQKENDGEKMNEEVDK